jgi:hypothetical protein
MPPLSEDFSVSRLDGGSGGPILSSMRVLPAGGVATSTSDFQAAISHPNQQGAIVIATNAVNQFIGMQDAFSVPVQFTNTPGVASSGAAITPDTRTGNGFIIAQSASADLWRCNSVDPLTATFSNMGNSTAAIGPWSNATGNIAIVNGQIMGRRSQASNVCDVSQDNGISWTQGNLVTPGGGIDIDTWYQGRDGSILAVGGAVTVGIGFYNDLISFTPFAGFATGFSAGTGTFNDNNSTLVFAGGGVGQVNFARSPWTGFTTIDPLNSPFQTSAAAGFAISSIRYSPKFKGWLICSLAGEIVGLLLESDLTTIIPGSWINKDEFGGTIGGATVDRNGNLLLCGLDCVIAVSFGLRA